MGHSHAPDTSAGGSQNVAHVTGTETGGITELSFDIPLNSGDSHDIVLAAGQSYLVLLSYGSSDDITSQHAARGSITVTL